jgi:hypothetical protein
MGIGFHGRGLCQPSLDLHHRVFDGGTHRLAAYREHPAKRSPSKLRMARFVTGDRLKHRSYRRIGRLRQLFGRENRCPGLVDASLIERGASDGGDVVADRHLTTKVEWIGPEGLAEGLALPASAAKSDFVASIVWP